jgi:hypothetical protein
LIVAAIACVGVIFLLTRTQSGTAMVTEFYDQAGNVRIVYVKEKGFEDFYRPGQPDRVLTSRYSMVQQLEMVSSEPSLWISEVVARRMISSCTASRSWYT